MNNWSIRQSLNLSQISGSFKLKIFTYVNKLNVILTYWIPDTGESVNYKLYTPLCKNIPLYLRSLSNSGNLPRTLNTIFWMEYLKSFVGDGKGKHIKADPGFTVDAVQSRDRAIKRIKLISAREAVNCNFVRVFIKVLKTTSWKDFFTGALAISRELWGLVFL